MGCGSSSAANQYRSSGTRKAPCKSGFARSTFGAIPDRYDNLDEVSQALRLAGLESSQLIVGVDFTKSNTWNGKQTFGGKCLHSLQSGTNPYQEVLAVVAEVLRDFDDDGLIPAYGFGDKRTNDNQVFSFQPDDAPCDGLGDCLARYAAISQSVDFYGPTNFAPLIREAIKQVRETGEYHILLIIADGQVDKVQDTIDAIVEASNYPLSIAMIGVGDGPWDMMEKFDDELPERRFDNFQFVNFSEICRKYPGQKLAPAFAVHALMEVPDQYKLVKELGLLKDAEQLRRRPFKPVAAVQPPPAKSLEGRAMAY